jgi:pimeloyl-ACP methyl ester carboxylesterase
LAAAAARRGVAERLVLLDPVLPAFAEMHRLQRTRERRNRIEWVPIARAANRRRRRFDDKAQAVAAYRGRGAFGTWTGDFLADYVEDGFVPQPQDGVALACAPEWEASSFAGLRFFAAPLLRRVMRPVAILGAEQRSTLRLPLAALTRYKPDLSLEVVPGSTHFLPMEQPELVRERLRAALAARAQEP